MCVVLCCGAQAALQLGMRAARRPAGYWSSWEVLDMELDAFIAGASKIKSKIVMSIDFNSDFCCIYLFYSI
jgi:hypothetical protein